MDTLTQLPPDFSETFELYLAEFFGRQVINGLISGTLTPERAHGLARMAGSYGRRYLDRRDAHRDVVQLGFNVIHASFGGGR